MNIVLLQGASGDTITGPVVRVPSGEYRVEMDGHCDGCQLFYDSDEAIQVNKKITLERNSTVWLIAVNAKKLTVRFIKE